MSLHTQVALHAVEESIRNNVSLLRGRKAFAKDAIAAFCRAEGIVVERHADAEHIYNEERLVSRWIKLGERL